MDRSQETVALQLYWRMWDIPRNKEPNPCCPGRTRDCNTQCPKLWAYQIVLASRTQDLTQRLSACPRRPWA